ncbi:glycosyltransferase family 2 protein [Selenomonas ruminantium]|uniref:Glycosyl transferase family 2 n=1 Tax=Selenomonas ruminantium TaxID=971 RepID=A0A1I0YEQ1_SELRU|nr:glycosyltransferase family 2 protein [Selenomonas ruminantium]SFB11671.1 Glycosyl transferase family 2 [Selenomonas ruminantium]
MQPEKRKIIVVTITRIESDIIESFVRHTLTFADEIIIYDNGSTDGTQEILDELCAEGLPLVVQRQTGNVEFNHGECMTCLCFAARKHQADLIVPLDVDEFLVNTANTTSVKEILADIKADEVVIIPLVEYKLPQEYHGESFLPWHECLRVCTTTGECNFSPKCIVGGGMVKEGFSLAQGCHYAMQQGKKLPYRQLPFLHLAHFHYRSEVRYQAKTILGWLGTVCKYGLHTLICDYMKKNYQHMLDGCNNYVNQGGKILDESIDLRGFCSSAEVRYADLIKVNLLRTVMEEAQLLAASYVAEKAKRTETTVDILVPFWGVQEELSRILSQIDKQTYPWWKLWVLCLSDAVPEIQAKGNFSFEVVDFSHTAAREQLWGRLAGDYTFWFMPGRSITRHHISQLVTTVLMNGYKWHLVIMQQRGRGDVMDRLVPADSVFAHCNAGVFWQEFASRDWDGAAALQNTLIPSKLQQGARGCFIEALTSPVVDYQKIWRGLLTDSADVSEQEICLFFYRQETVADRLYQQAARENRRAATFSEQIMKIL